MLGSGRCLGGRHGNTLQYQENPMGWGAWWATVHGVAKSQTWLKQLSTHTLYDVVFQSLSRVSLFATQWTAARQAPLSSIISWSLFKFMSIESVMLSYHLILCCPLLLLLLIFPSIRVFSKESALCIRLPEYWSFSFSHSPSNVYSGLISFRIDWFDLLAVPGTLKSLLQHHDLQALIIWHSAFFMV